MSEHVFQLSTHNEKRQSSSRDALQLQFRRSRYDDRDYEAAVAIENSYFPESAQDVASWRHWDSSLEPRFLWRRYIAELNGKIVATGELGHTSWSYQPGKFFIFLAVAPRYQGRGIGSSFYNFLLDDARLLQATKLVTRTREDYEQSFRFLKKRGFKSVMRMPTASLQVSDFDPAPFRHKVQHVLQSGIEIKTMAQLRREDPEWKRKIHDVRWLCLKDVPHAGARTPESLEQFENRLLNSPRLLEDGWFIAVDGERYVGLSFLWRNTARPDLLATGLTGVIRSYRRRGVATALKVHALDYARAYGAQEVTTDNEENNPMFRLNLQLGFKARPAFLELHKNLLPAV